MGIKIAWLLKEAKISSDELDQYRLSLVEYFRAHTDPAKANAADFEKVWSGNKRCGLGSSVY